MSMNFANRSLGIRNENMNNNDNNNRSGNVNNLITY